MVAGTDELLGGQARILEQIVRGEPLGEVLAALCRLVEAMADAQVRAEILLVDADGKHLRIGAAPSLPDAYNAEIDGLPISPDLGTCSAAAARGEPVVTSDIATCDRWTKLAHLALAQGLVAAWSMPIRSSGGAVLGTFGTYFFERREPMPHERRLVEVLTQTAALALERDRVEREQRAAARRLQFLAELGAATQVLEDPDEVMADTARRLAEHLEVDRCAYAEVEDERVFVITGDHARGVPSIVGRWAVAAFGPEHERALLAGEPFVVEDSEADERLEEEHREAYRALASRAVICVPLHKGGRVRAAMAVHHRAPRVWTRDEIELVATVVARCWEALERSRVTRDLRESEARYRSIVEATPECVKIVARDGVLLQINAAGLRMIGAPSEASVIGHRVYDMVVPEDRARYRAFNEEVCRGQNGRISFEIIGFGGARRSMETTAVALPAAGGGFVQLAVTRDVTDRVAAEHALVESRARLEYAVLLSGVGFWYCDLPFDELTWDERVKAHFFLPPDARVTIETFYDRIHPDDREATRRAIDAAIMEHGRYDVVYRTVDPASGACKWIRAIGGTAYDPDGTPRRFDGVTVDITAQKLEEERLARVAAAAVRIHSASTLNDVLEVIVYEARMIIGAHQGVASFTDAPDWAQAINAVSLSDKYARHRAYAVRPTGAGIYSVVCRTNRPMRMTQAELEAHPAFHSFAGDAEHPPMRGWLAVPFVGRDGTNLGIVQLSDKHEGEFTASDEAVLVQLAAVAAVAIENARLYDRLRDQDRCKDEFLATLAHELRNPLAPIRTGLQLLRQEPAQAPRITEMMDRQLGHLVRIVDDLLDISRITLGKVSLVKAQVDLRAVLDSALETTRPLVEAGAHELVLRLPDGPLPLDADATRLSQVFSNLINNAAKYTPRGGRITIEAALQGGALEVRVSDTGVGIPPDMLPRVFDMFTQVGRTIERSQGGLGIGLTLVRRLAEMHGGTVEAASAGVGKGSTFTVRLPLAAKSVGAGAAQKAAPAADGAKLKILVVDDNVDAAEMLAMLLEAQGNETRLAHTGPEALVAASQLEPDLIFLDIGLPEMNGYEVAMRLREDPRLRACMLVALTGWGSEDDRRQAHEAGFDRHLVKPVDSEKLRDVLTAARG